MAITTPESLIKLLEKSKLLTPEQLAEARDLADKTDQPRAIAKALVHAKMLTRWQAGQLLAGRSSFFLGKYKLVDLLGRGGMGSVFFAHHTTMNRPVALKIISKQLGRDPESLERFFTEARAIAALDHPNIVHAYSIDNEGDRYYIVMEFVQGQNLQAIVDAKGPLDHQQAGDTICQAAAGLAHAHSRDIIHCDIKPANLLVNQQGVVKILDMGMARLIGRGKPSDSGASDLALGTVDYLAPEQGLESPQMDHRADIYSLGCTLYFLLTGHPPFPEGTLHERIVKHQTQEPNPIVAERPDAPKDLVAICAKMMAKDPADRFQTADEVVQLLTDWHPPKRKLRKAVPLEQEEEEEPAEVLPAHEADDAKKDAALPAPAAAAGAAMASRSLGQLYRQRPRLVLFSGLGAVAALALVAGLVAMLSSSDEKPAPNETARAAPAETAKAPEQEPAPAAANATDGQAWPDVVAPDAEFDPAAISNLLGNSDKPDAKAKSSKPEAQKAAAQKSPPAKPGPDKTDKDKPARAKPGAQKSGAKKPADAKPGAAAAASGENGKKKPQSKKPAEKKTDEPSAKPAEKPAKTPADKPAEKPAGEGSSPAKKPAATAKPAAKKKGPFDDFPETVEIAEFRGGDTEPIELGKVHLAADDSLQLLLGGGETALKSTRLNVRKFVLNSAETDSAKARWAIQLVESSSGGQEKTTDVADIRRAGDSLVFRWAADADPASANYLRNCILQLRAGGASHYVSFLRPVHVEPITIDLVRGTTNINAPVEDLPETSKLRVQITKVEGREGHRVEPVEPVEPGTPLNLIFDRTDRHGNTRDRVEFRVTFTARSSGLACKLQLMVEPGTREFFRKLQSLSAQNLTIQKNNLDTQKNKILRDLNPPKKDQAPRGAERSKLNAQIDEIEKMLWYIEFFEQVHDQAKVHFELFSDVDGRKLVFSTTEGQAEEGGK